ncbi:MAG: hypothetical protein RL352_94 [Actinomycetota bacterium]
MRVVVVGAGISGLLAARRLVEAGHTVTTFDKGRSSGGRCATRRIGSSTFDHGAQFFTVRSDEFAALVHGWLAEGIAKEWCRGFSEHDGHPRYCGVNGMTSITKRLADGLDVRYSSMVFSLERLPRSWRVHLDDGTSVETDHVVLTCPVPQSMALIVNTDVEVPDAIRTIEYDKIIAALVVVEGETNVPAPGGVQNADTTFSFIADNKQKGISGTGALTFHCSPSFSEEHWWTDAATTHEDVMRRAQEWIGDAKVVEHQPKRWRMAAPRTTWHERCWSSSGVTLAGDAFAGPKVEGAALSGLAAAQRVLSN